MTRARALTAAVWDHFDEVDRDEKKALCKYCNKTLSYKSTITNLKLHLKQKHISIYEECITSKSYESVTQVTFIEDSIASDTEEKMDTTPNNLEDFVSFKPKKQRFVQANKANNSIVWNYFEILDTYEKRAVCNYCKKILSYKSTITNLKLHLKQKHNSVYKECIAAILDKNLSKKIVQEDSIQSATEEEAQKTDTTPTKINLEEFVSYKPQKKVIMQPSKPTKFRYIRAANTQPNTTSETEFDAFAKSIAAQLNSMPKYLALKAQACLQSCLSEIRIKNMKKRKKKCSVPTTTTHYLDTQEETSPSSSESEIKLEEHLELSTDEEDPL